VAENHVELAKLLGVTRRPLQNWSESKGAPQPAASGFYEVAAWREIRERNGLEGESPATEEETILRVRKLLAEVEEQELHLAVKKGEYIAVEEVRTPWTGLIAKATEIEMELRLVLSGLDAVAIQVECTKALHEVFKLLSTPGGGAA
jgi:hypothetical protein